MSNHPLTDEFFDKLGVYGDGSQTPYQFACELEKKLQAECRSTTKLTNELLGVKLELAVANKLRDALLGLVEKMASIIGPPGEETWADDFDIEAAWDAYQALTNQIKGGKA